MVALWLIPYSVHSFELDEYGDGFHLLFESDGNFPNDNLTVF
jgi:hypothetical protein